MYVKLALRNVKRSAKDYLVYKIIIPLIALLLVFLISYVNHYMIKQRKKEFVLQIIMGMERGTVAYLFFIEMLIMGTIAVVLGILLGTLLSQIVSAIIMTSFSENYQFYFSIFPDTIVWTLGFFSALFIVIGLGNVRVIRKQKIIDMLHDSHKTESGLTIKEMLSKSLVVGALLAISILYLNLKGIFPFWEKLNTSARTPIAFCIAATLLFLFLVVAFFIMASIAKDKVNFLAAMLSVSSTASGILLLRTVSIYNGLVIIDALEDIYIIAPTLLAAGMLLFGITSFFACLSWLLSLAKEKSVKLKYKHLFLLGQLGSKMKTNANTMSVLSCILICSLVLLGWMPTLAGQVDGYLSARTVYDVQIFSAYKGYDSIHEISKSSLNYSYIDSCLEEGGYEVTGTANVETYFLKESDFNVRVQKDMPILAISLSDYNALLRLSGHEEITLSENSFAVAWYHTVLKDKIKNFHKQNRHIQAGNYKLTKADGGDYQVNVGMGIFTSGMDATYILPDSVCDALTLASVYYTANTTKPLSYEFATALDPKINEWLDRTGVIPPDSGFVRLKTLQMNEGISNSLMIRLGSTYTSLVLIIICLTVLALQQLTDATEHRQRFSIIAKLGVDKEQISRYIRQQMSIWFGIPIIFASLGAGITLTYLLVARYESYIPYVTLNQAFINCLSVYGIFAIVFFCYFEATYLLFQRNAFE